MNLEDDLRRVGEARAAEARRADRRPREAVSTTGRRLIAAGVVLVATVAAIAIITADDDVSEVAVDEPLPAESVVERWIPPTRVTHIDYGISQFGWLLATPMQEVALITTPDDATDLADDDWTLITRSGPGIFLIGEDGDPGPRESDGTSYLQLGPTVINSRRFTAATLAGKEATLRELSDDVALLAAEMASWDPDVEVVYSGPVAGIDVLVGGDDPTDDGVVGWIAATSGEHWMASYRWAVRSEGNATDEVFALEEPGLLTPGYVAIPAAPAPMRVTEQAWLAVVEKLLGPDPAMTFTDPARLPVSASAVARADAYTVEVTFAAPISLGDDGIVAEAVSDNGAIRLVFGLPETVTVVEAAAVSARMSHTEAERYAELLNRSLGQPEPQAVEPPDPYPAVDPGAPCASNPAPSAHVLDEAVHITADRTPLDLDGDGIDDEILTYADANGDWWVIARLGATQEWTTPAFVGTRWPPELAPRPLDGGPAHTDLDGDGNLEFFVTATGNTARNVALVSLSGCDLARIGYRDHPADDPAFDGLILVGVGGNSCAPTGCWPRVSCPSPGELLVEIAEPAAIDTVVWTSTPWRLVDDVLVEGVAQVIEFDPDAWPTLAPTAEDSDLVNC